MCNPNQTTTSFTQCRYWKIQAVTGLPADDVHSSYHRCTSYAGCILLCFSGPGATIEAWTAKKRVNRWEAPISCVRDERICCFGLSSKTLGLTITKSEQGSRFELRQRETMAMLRVIQLQFACYRLSSLNEHTCPGRSKRVSFSISFRIVSRVKTAI